MKPDKERQIIKRLVEQQLFLEKQRMELFRKTNTSLTSYSDPRYTVDFIDVACDILGFPIDTVDLQATGKLSENIPTEKLYSRMFLPFLYDMDKEPIDEILVEKVTKALYDKLHNDMLQFPELFIDK